MANENLAISEAQRLAALKYLQDTGGSATATATGTTADAAYTGTGNATVISLLKGIYAQLVIIAANTTPTP